jgi:hypothetical protein
VAGKVFAARFEANDMTVQGVNRRPIGRAVKDSTMLPAGMEAFTG